MVDINRELTAVQRETGPGKTPVGEGKTVLLRRTYKAEIEDVWDAMRPPRCNSTMRAETTRSLTMCLRSAGPSSGAGTGGSAG